MTPVGETLTKRYPLHLTIAFVFSGLFLIVGLALISYNYHESRKMVLAEADRFLASAADGIETRVAQIYRPVLHLVEVSSQMLSSGEQTLDERLHWLDYMSEALRVDPYLSALFIGYDDGDFFLVRRHETRSTSPADAQVPAGTFFVVQSIDQTQSPRPTEERLYFDRELNPLGRERIVSTGYDPRERGWYQTAMDSDSAINSGFYVFFTTRETGLTVARRVAGGGAVVGADLALIDLDQALQRQKLTPSTRIAVLNGDGGVIALSEESDEVPLVDRRGIDRIEMPRLVELGDSLYRHLGEYLQSAGLGAGTARLEVDGRVWASTTTRIAQIVDHKVYLAVALPMDELLSAARRVQIVGTLISLAILIVALVLVIGVSRSISRSLGRLADEAERIREFRFDLPLTCRSRIREVDDLARTMALMKSSIVRFLEISDALSAEKDYRRVLELVLSESIHVAQADAGAVLMLSEEQDALEVAIHADEAGGVSYVAGAEKTPDATAREPGFDSEPVGGRSVEAVTATEGRTVRLDDLARTTGFDVASVHARFDRGGLVSRAVLSVPLKNQADEIIGVLQLVKTRPEDGTEDGFRTEMVAYVEALASDAAVALDIRRLLKAQRDLLDSLILMIAGAIDAKSPYTSGHCQRVPVVASILANAADRARDGTFRDFELSEDERYQLHLASWLHDCGKVTTPEYVVDKATKLETIYNRIHEIRMRFEVLWRDAEIDGYRRLVAGEIDRQELATRLDRRRAEIVADLELIARCNLGAEVVTDEDLARLQRIASQTWVRNLDDRLGLSHGELAKLPQDHPEPPVEEPVLVDRPEHILPRSPEQNPFGDDSYGFRMEIPEHQYNRGELYNLAVARGTLTTEERFKINEHAIQTIRMLENLPFPRELRQVPDWAGNHHEKLDGSGYPRRLAAADLSIPERIMAIADIFEALTARDRPYSAPRSLSQALGIMSSMCSAGHLCPDLFALFLNSGAFLEYGREYLDPTQLDEVDIETLVAATGG